VTIDVGALAGFLVIAAVAGLVGLVFGIFFLAPRIARLLDRHDEDPGAGDD
jgi:hypothetical protein